MNEQIPLPAENSDSNGDIIAERELRRRTIWANAARRRSEDATRIYQRALQVAEANNAIVLRESIKGLYPAATFVTACLEPDGDLSLRSIETETGPIQGIDVSALAKQLGDCVAESWQPFAPGCGLFWSQHGDYMVFNLAQPVGELAGAGLQLAHAGAELGRPGGELVG